MCTSVQVCITVIIAKCGNYVCCIPTVFTCLNTSNFFFKEVKGNQNAGGKTKVPSIVSFVLQAVLQVTELKMFGVS